MKKFFKGLTSVASVDGAGMVAGIFLVLVILSYVGWSPEAASAKIRAKTGG